MEVITNGTFCNYIFLMYTFIYIATNKKELHSEVRTFVTAFKCNCNLGLHFLVTKLVIHFW